MVVHNNLFVNIITFSFLIFRASAGADNNLRMRIYNSDVNHAKTYAEPNKYYYSSKNDVLTVTCSHTKYNDSKLPNGHTLGLYYSSDDTENDKDSKECLGTSETGKFTSKVPKGKLSKKADGNRLICGYANGKTKYELSIRVFLYPEPPTIIINNIPFNKSLSNPNIYEGRLGEKLDIVCQKNTTDKKGILQWENCKNIQDSSCRVRKSEYKQNISYPPLQLDEEHDGVEIKCALEINNEKVITSVFLKTSRIENEIGESDSSNTTIWLIVGGGTSVVIVLVIIIFNLSLKKKSSHIKDDEEITYENLTNEVPIPRTFPNNDRLQDIYLKPSQSQYENTMQSYNDANIYDLYSKPLPKSQRNPAPQHLEKKEADSNEPNYAEIETLHIQPSKKDLSETKNTEYATVINSNSDYANVNDYTRPGACGIKI